MNKNECTFTMNLLLSLLGSILMIIIRIDAKPRVSHKTHSNLTDTSLKRESRNDEDLPIEFKKVKRELILHEHNKYRVLHGARKLELNDNVIVIPDELGTITWLAELWAEDLSYIGVVGRRQYNTEYGQNVWIKKTQKYENLMTQDDFNPVKNWYEQKLGYKGYYNPHGMDTSAFTQVVWRSSERLGVGIAYGEIFGWTLYVVCFYYPPGNLIDDEDLDQTNSQFGLNVLPSKNDRWLIDLPITFPVGKIYIVCAVAAIFAATRLFYYVLIECGVVVAVIAAIEHLYFRTLHPILIFLTLPIVWFVQRILEMIETEEHAEEEQQQEEEG